MKLSTARLFTFSLVLLLSLISGSISAQTFLVNDNGDNGGMDPSTDGILEGTLRKAIVEVGVGDANVIEFDPNVFDGSQPQSTITHESTNFTIANALSNYGGTDDLNTLTISGSAAVYATTTSTETVDQVGNTRASGFADLGALEVSVVANSLPTSADFTLAVGVENLLTIAAADFPYIDTDGDALASIKLVAIPGDGILFLDTNGNGAFDGGGESISNGDDLTLTKLTDLRYLAVSTHGSTTFTFSVNDDTGNSSPTYTATLWSVVNGLDFDGANDYLNVGNFPNFNFGRNDAFTIECWIKPGALTNGSVILAKENVGVGYSISTRDDGKLRFKLRDGTNDIIEETNANDLVVGSWTHVAITYNGSMVNNGILIYINGIVSNSTLTVGTLSSTTVNVGSLVLGANSNMNNNVNLGMDELRIWSVVRTAEEIRQSAAGRISSPRTVNNLELYYDFNQGDPSGDNTGLTTVWDQSSNGYDGTVTNFDLDGSNTGGAVSNWVASTAFASAQPDIQITDDVSTDISNGDTFSFGLFNFVDAINESRTFAINNDGLADLTISGSGDISVSGSAYTLDKTGLSFPLTIGAGLSRTFDLVWTETAGTTATRSETITINSDDPNEGTFTFTAEAEVLSIENTLDFDGVNDHLIVGNHPNLDLTRGDEFTIEFWVNPGNLMDDRLILGKEDGNGAGYSVSTRANGRLQFRYGDGTNELIEKTNAGDLVIGSWTHVAITYNGSLDNSGVMIYINGAVSNTTWTASTLTTPTAVNVANFILGARYAGLIDNSNLKIDEFRFWSVVRTEAEIRQSATGRISSPTTVDNLELYYDFNQGDPSGDNTGLITVTDRSVNGNDGVATNFDLDGSNTGGAVSNWVASDAFTSTAVTTPTMVVTESSTVYSDGGTAYDFGKRQIRTYTDITFQIENHGFVDIVLDGVPSASQNFSIVLPYTPPVTLNPGGSQVLKVRYSPVNVGDHNGFVTIPNDAGVDYQLGVTGIGRDRYLATWLDASGDGDIDQVEITFGGTVDITDGTIGDAFDAFTFTNGISVTSIGDFNLTNQTSITLTVSGVTGTTSPSTTISYNAAADVSISEGGSEFTDGLEPTIVIDGAAPVFKMAHFYDVDSNGNIDEIVLEFSEEIDEGTVETGDFTIGGEGSTINTVEDAPLSSGTATLDLSDNDKYVTLMVVVAGTNDRNLSYDGSTGGSQTIEDLEKNETIHTGTITRDDKAFPSFSAEALDIGSDGSIDEVIVRFSENISDADFNALDFTIFGVNPTGLAAFPSTTDIVDDNVLYLAFSGLGTRVLTLTYSGTTLKDDNNNFVVGGDVFVIDSAPPVILSKEFKDTDLNGRIDQVEIVLSEDVTGVSMDDFIFNTAGYSFNSVSEIDGAITLGVQEISSKFDTYASLNMTIIANRIVDLYTNSPNDVLDAGIAFDLDDKAPPYLEVVPQSESTLSGFTIKGTVDDPDAKVFVEVEDATFATIDDTTTPPEWSIPGAVSNAGTYNVRVIASDAFSNVGQDTSIDELVIMGGLTITRADAPSVVCENSDYTTLSDLVFTEVGMGDFAIQSDKIMLIQAPEAFEFDTDVSTVTVSDDSGGSEVGITVSFIGTAILQLTLNVTGTTEMNIMRISDLKVTSTGDGKAELQDMVRIAGDASVFGAGNGTVFGRMEDAPTPVIPTDVNVTNGPTNVTDHAIRIGETFELTVVNGAVGTNWYEPDGTTLIYTGKLATAANLAINNTISGLYTFRVTNSNTSCESEARTINILIYDDRDPSGNNSFINRTYNVTDPTDDIYMSNPSGHTVAFTSDGGGFNLVSTGNPIHAQFTPGTAGVQGGNPHSISYQITNDLTSETFTLVREFVVQSSTDLFVGSPADKYCELGGEVTLKVNAQQFNAVYGTNPYLLKIVGKGLLHEATHGGLYELQGGDLHGSTNSGRSTPMNAVMMPGTTNYQFKFNPDEFAPPAGGYEIVHFNSNIVDADGTMRIGAEQYFTVYGVPALNLSNISQTQTYCSSETSFDIRRDIEYVGTLDVSDPTITVATSTKETNQNITNGYTLYRSTDDGVTYTDLVGDFTGTNVQNTFNPNDPDQDGIIDADDIGFFRLEYTTGAVGAGACSVTITRDIKIFEQPDMPTLASDSYTDQNGVLTLQGNGDYFIEMCQFASLPTISLANGSPTDVTWYNSSQVAIVGFKDSVNIPADQLGFILDANGVLSAEQLGLEFYISTTSGDGCESELRKVRVNVYGKEDSPQLILGATFDEDDVRSGSRIFYSYELDYCTSTDGGNATANNLILPALGTGEKYTIGTSFDDGTNPGTYSTPTYADYTTNIIDLSSYVMAGGQSYKYEIYLEHDINVATGFMSCLSYITEVRTYGHNTPSAPTVADFNDGVLDYHVAEGNVLDPIFHANVGMDEYYWYEEDTRNTAFTNNPYSSGSPISVNAFKALLTSGKKLIVSNLNEAEDAGNDGVNDVYTYYVSRLDNKVGANDFDGCESNDNTAVSITVHTKQAAPSIVSDNTSGTQGQPVAFPNEKINNLGGNNEYHYSICVDQVESTLKFTTSQGIFGYYTNLSNGGVDRFTKGELITGQTSDATAYIAINNDAIGELSLINSAGTFTPNEQIVGASSGTTADLLSIHKFSGDSRFEWYAYTGGNGRGNLLYTGTSPTFVELQLSSITQAGNKFFEVIQVTDTDVFDGVESESTLVRVEFFASNNFKFTKISDEEYFCHDEVSVGSVDAQGRIQLALEEGGNAVMPTDLTYSVVSEPTDFADNLVVGSNNVIMDDIGAGGDGIGNPVINLKAWHLAAGGQEVGGEITSHTITMDYVQAIGGCAISKTFTIYIHPDPDITFTLNGSVNNVEFCYDDAKVHLAGFFATSPLSPLDAINGTFNYSGAGISDNNDGTATFNPVTAHGSDRFAVRSSHTITFTYTDQFGCQNDVTETVFVNPLPEPVDDIVGGEIQFEVLCRGLIKTAFVDIVGVTDYSNHTFVWELPGGSSYTGGGMVVNNAGQITITKTGDNTLDFDNDNSIFAISTIVTNNLTGCSIELTESETQGFSPEPSFTYVGITENSATGLDIQFFQDNPSLNNNDLTHLEFSLIGGPTTIAPIIRSGNGVSAFDLSDANITGLAAGEYTATITMKTIKGCEITAPRRVITILPIIDVGNPNIGGQYKEGFNGGYAHGWYIERASEDGKNDTMRISSWELVGAPGVVYTPYDTIVKHLDKKDPYEGDGMFITDWDDSYKPNEVSYVYSPAFDLDQFGNPAISFQHWRDFDSPRDGLTVQISGDDGRNWIGLGNNDLSLVNWYTHQGVSSGPGEGARSPELATNPIAVGFADAVRDPVTNKAIVNWAESRQAINKASPDVNLIRFRFALAAGGGAKVTTGQVGGAEVNLSVADGFAFDDFKIYEKNKRVLVEQFSSSLDAESKRNEFFIQEGKFENGTDGLPQNLSARKHTINWMDGTSGIWINYYTDVFNKGMQRDAINARNKVDPATRSTLYGVSGAPVTRVAGDTVTYSLETNPEDFGNEFNAISLEAPDFLIPNTDFVLDASASNDVISGSAKFISQVENDEEVELAFFFAVVEKRIPAMSSASMNGLDDPSSEYTRETDTLRHALRVLLPGASGNFYKGTLKQFQNFDFDFEWTVSEVYNVEELRVIAFVQYYNDVLKGNSVEQSNFLDITGKSNVVTGIDHIQDILTVYPNPAGDLINLTLPDAPSEDVYWTIYDQSGKQSLKGVIKRGTKIPDPIDSSNLPSGMYIIQLYNEKRVWTPKKVSIAH